jgi:hypothetical protein
MPGLAQDLVIIAPNRTFLGLVARNRSLCSSYDSDCIWNTLSPYGTEYSSRSVFSNYSQYGSEIGRYSICNADISYNETPALYIVNDNQVTFFDVIGPDSETQIGYDIYVSACFR